MTCHNIEAGVYIVGISDMHVFPLETHAYGPSIVAPFFKGQHLVSLILSFENITKESHSSFRVVVYCITKIASDNDICVAQIFRGLYDRKTDV